jgi:hypothetical protein
MGRLGPMGRRRRWRRGGGRRRAPIGPAIEVASRFITMASLRGATLWLSHWDFRKASVLRVFAPYPAAGRLAAGGMDSDADHWD